MREIRPSGSEGGGAEINRPSLPLSWCQHSAYFRNSNSCAGCARMRMKTGSLRQRGGSAPPARTRCALRRSAPTWCQHSACFRSSRSWAGCAPMRMKTGTCGPQRWVRAAGADKMRAAAQRAHFGASTPPVFGTVTHVPDAHPCVKTGAGDHEVGWDRGADKMRARRSAPSAPASVLNQRGASPLQAYALRPVTDCNCVAARRGGEQQEVNDQSVG